MRLSMKIVESNSQIQKMILEALIDEANNYMKTGINTLKRELSTIVTNAIKNTPEYQSLVGGKLRLEFGISDADQKIAQLIEGWMTTIVYEYSAPTISAGKIKASFSAKLIRSDFSDILGGDFAYVIDSVRGYSLPWLEWLLLEGNRVLVPKQQVVIGPSKYSRTGYAIMREAKSGWKVPSEFAGTISDNWITRALDNTKDDIETLLNKAFQ